MPELTTTISAQQVRRRWPLTGRGQDVAAILQALLADGPDGVLLVGDTGVGKSRVVEAVLHRCAVSSCHTARIVCTPADRDVPFGAVRQLLPEPGDPADPVAALLKAARGRTVVIAIDDASWLDEDSAAVLQRLVVHAGARVLMATEAAPAEGLRRWGRWSRMDLAPLDRARTKDLVEAVLGAPVDGLTLDGLWRVSGGNPLFLRELLCGAVDDGALVTREGVVTWRDGAIGDAHSSDTAAAALDALSAEELDALRYLAVAHSAPLEVMERLVPMPVLERLEEQRLIQFDQSGRVPLLRVAHPLHAHTVVARTGALRIYRIRNDLATTMMACRPDDRVRTVQWRLAAQLDVPDDEVLAAADEALRDRDVAVAEQLSRQVATPAGAWRLGRALVARGENAEAEKWLAEAARKLVDPAARANVAALRAVNLFWGFRDPRRALEVVAEAKAAIAAEDSGDLLAAEALVLVFDGRVEAADEMVTRLLDRPPDDPVLVGAMAPLRPQLLLFTGRPARAIEELAAARGAFGGAWPTMRAMTQVCHVHALVMAGAVERAAETVQRYYHDAVEQGSAAGVALVALAGGICSYYQGRTEQAARWLREARALTDSQPRFRFRETVLAISAGVAAGRGLVDEARELLDRLGEAGADPSAADYGAFGEVWALVLAGDREGAGVVLRRRAEEALAVGNVLMATEFLHVDIRFNPSAATVARLRKIAENADGELFGLLADHAAALVDQDLCGMNRVSAAFERRGYHGFALEAAATGATFRGGREVNALARRTQRLLGEHQGAWPEWLPPPRSSPVLTCREKQISELAASGMETAAIARALSVSPRTVENHLQRAYDKLGIHRRTELAAALAEDGLIRR
ncbi:LuxR C-terminal-related transcriptional regulator [Nonomuraea harbinensis]|uniref:LuxR C-terminal-related transcriptional regulator n=1 Tax=Nonomuraea harbinensis TaxID=1286938 RepID=A0ABW1BWI0_9ACTN|nr:LuxR C-terminal-related transcriptional regulator [Nonomuraea harbinensis]